MSGGEIAKDIGMALTKGAVSSVTGAADLPAYATQGALAGIDFVNEKVLEESQHLILLKALSKIL